MFKSLDSIASVVGIFMYLTISKFKQVLRSRKGLDYNTGYIIIYSNCFLPIGIKLNTVNNSIKYTL